MKTHGNPLDGVAQKKGAVLWVRWKKIKRVYIFFSKIVQINVACKCARVIFIPCDSAFVFITTINMAEWIFGRFLQTPLCIVWMINTLLSKHGDGFSRVLLWLRSGAEVWTVSLNVVGENVHFLKHFLFLKGARQRNELPAAPHRKLLCEWVPVWAHALCNPFRCIRRSKAAAETCLLESAAESNHTEHSKPVF